MANTDFNTEKLDPESVEDANSRLAKILAATPHQVAPDSPRYEGGELSKGYGTTLLPTPMQLAGLTGVNEPRQADPETKKQRTTVARLAQRYQDRVEELDKSIEKLEEQLQEQEEQLDIMKYKREVWAEALAEIQAD